MKRFTTVDPIRDGSNWYAYVNNNPINFIDPWGLETAFAPGTTAEEIAAYEIAIVYLKGSDRGAELLNKLEESTEVITISINDDDNDSYNPATNTVNWDPDSGLVTGSGEIQSAAIGLIHELGHAEQDLNDELKDRSRLEIEEENLARTENPVAKQLGEPTRDNYFDVDPHNPVVTTTGPTSQELLTEGSSPVGGESDFLERLSNDLKNK
jgi:uncharacterized protein RhaS with RHS repeats